MKIKALSPLLAFLFAFNLVSIAQNDKDPVLMTISGKDVSRSEFESVYYKNSNKQASIDEKSLPEYLELFINFKLKVKEAEELGLDTTKAFKDELQGYRKQLAQPYLTDNEVNEHLLLEAYDRLKTEINASHILIKVDENALPKDTLAAYTKLMSIRNRIKKGEDFGAVASGTSEDPSAKDNGGNLGYFTALQMVYPFESAAYNTKVKEISLPVRTRFGYHLIQVMDKRAARGQMHAAHIMITTPPTMSPEDSTTAVNKVNEIYSKLKKGGNFEELAQQFSDDKGSAKKGGELPLFGTGRMVPEFENAAFGLTENGAFSAPFKTRFGWHIVKRLDKKEIDSFEDMKSELKNKVSKDSRTEKSKEALIGRIKKENNFKEDLKARDEFIKMVDKSFFEGNWTAEKLKGLNKPLFNLSEKVYTQKDFAAYVEKRQSKQPAANASIAINRMYDSFVEESSLAYEESRLEQKYPEFKSLMQEYRDGILLFELTDQKVWSKAVKDTSGLEKYYDNNKTNFMWEERVDATIYTCSSAEIAAKTRKIAAKAKKKNYTNEDVLKMINVDSELNLKIESGKFVKGENDITDKIIWAPGLTDDIKNDKQVVFVMVHKKMAPEPKTLKEARGLVTAEYQAYLEKQWVDSLKEKYSVTVNKEVLAEIK